jgi:hypothetical protein
MRRYSSWAPSQFDTRGLGLPEHQDWFVAPCMRTRDSGILDVSNHECFLKLLADAGCEEDTDFVVSTFGHWGPGWITIVLVRPDSKAYSEAEAVESALADYPVLSEDDFSNREWEAAQEGWALMSLRERVRLCAESRVSIFAARRDSIPQEDNGRIFEICRGEY